MVLFPAHSILNAAAELTSRGSARSGLAPHAAGRVGLAGPCESDLNHGFSDLRALRHSDLSGDDRGSAGECPQRQDRAMVATMVMLELITLMASGQVATQYLRGFRHPHATTLSP